MCGYVCVHLTSPIIGHGPVGDLRKHNTIQEQRRGTHGSGGGPLAGPAGEVRVLVRVLVRLVEQ